MITFSSKAAIQEAIKSSITSSDTQAIKAMLRIFEYQTSDEQNCGLVKDYNGVGFTALDSVILTKFSIQYLEKKWLSPKQINLIKEKIGKYAGQLTNQAISKGIYVKHNGMWCIANV